MIRWDRGTARNPRLTRIERARAMRDRVLVWLPLLCGLQIYHLCALRLTGPDPDIVVSPDCQPVALLRRDRHGAPRCAIPLEAVPGLASLLGAYVEDARPVLLEGSEGSQHLLLDNHGRCLTRQNLASAFGTRLAPRIFDTDVTLTHLYRAWLALLAEGLRLTATDLRLVFRAQARWVMAPPSRPPDSESHLHRLLELQLQPDAMEAVQELRAWLRELGQNFARPVSKNAANARPA